MLSIDAVSKSFGQLRAVDNLSFDIPRGEIFGLLGPNGAGKSTTIAIASGLMAPDQGCVSVAGYPPTEKAARRVLGLVPQSIALYQGLSAVENLYFFARLYRLGKTTTKQRAAWALDFVGLADRARDKVKNLSGGMQRRLNLAASLLHEPDYIFMDEPTAGVDPQSRNKLFDSVLELKSMGKTVIYTTHYMEEAQKLCDRVGIVDHGSLKALDTVEGLINAHGGASRIRLTTERGEKEIVTETPGPTLARELEQEPGILDVRLLHPNLETVFLNLTGRQLRDN